jgi:hypothetical protein
LIFCERFLSLEIGAKQVALAIWTLQKEHLLCRENETVAETPGEKFRIRNQNSVREFLSRTRLPISIVLYSLGKVCPTSEPRADF